MSRLSSPLLSVIVPVYNVAPYLERCVGSILSQPYKALEIFLIDDGSTDGSGELCDQLAERDERIRVIHQPNAGLSAARNAGLDQMTGSVFTCVDSDDWLPEDAWSTPMDYLAEHEEIDLLELGYIEYTEPTHEERWVLHTGCQLSSLEAIKSLAKLDGVTGMAWGKLFRTSVVGGLRFPVGRPYEDTSFVFEALCRSRSYRYLAWPGYYYRVGRAGSITERYDARLSYLFTNLIELEPRVRELAPKALPWLYETLYRRLLIFSLWGMRHRQVSPELLSALLPWTARLRGLPYPEGSRTDQLRRQLFLRFPRLFLAGKRLASILS